MSKVSNGIILRAIVDGRAVEALAGPDAFRELNIVQALEQKPTATTDMLSIRTRLTVSDTPTNLDLAGGATDPITGAAQTFGVVQGFLVRNLSSSVALRVLGAAANGLAGVVSTTTAHIVVQPGGCVLIQGSTGYSVTAGTGDLFTLATGSGTAEADILIWGQSVPL